jgi:hypothetical protein
MLFTDLDQYLLDELVPLANNATFTVSGLP